MNSQRDSFIKNLIDQLGQKKSILGEKLTQAKKKMITAAEREKGSWSDHSMRDAEEEVAILTQQLEKVKGQIKEIENLSRKKITPNKVGQGSIVTAKINGEKQTFFLINSQVADQKIGLLSTQSLIGKALVGKKESQRFTVHLQTGSFEIKIIKLI
jgi:transcription elongation factor GreA